LQQALKQAYGIANPDPAIVDSSHGQADHFASLLAGFRVQPPVAATLRDAFDAAVAQALEHSYPGAPTIETEVRPADLRTVLEICERALDQPDHRVPQVPAADRRTMQRIANPLRLGVQSEQAFLLDVSPHWDTHFTRKLAERAQAGMDGQPTVAELRAWIDEPKPMGLSRDLQNLVILVWAAATDRTFTDHGGPANAGLTTLADHYEVVSQDLPDAATWAEACRRAEHVLGIAGLPPDPSAVGLARLSNALAEAAREHGEAVGALVPELQSLAALLGDAHANRVRTAEVAAALVHAIGAAGSDMAKVEAFVAADLVPSPPAIGASIKSASAAAGTIREVDPAILGTAMAKPEGSEIVTELGTLLGAEELATPLAPALRALYAQARDLVVGPVPPPPPGQHRVRVASEQGLDRAASIQRLEALREQLASEELRDARFDIEVTAIVSDTGE
jgi:hypothetical protein